MQCDSAAFVPALCRGAGEGSAFGAARIKGDILFRKREYPLWNPKRKASIASEQLEELQCLPIALPARGVAALSLLYDLPLLLLSAAALPVS